MATTKLQQFRHTTGFGTNAKNIMEWRRNSGMADMLGPRLQQIALVRDAYEFFASNSFNNRAILLSYRQELQKCHKKDVEIWQIEYCRYRT